MPCSNGSREARQNGILRKAWARWCFAAERAQQEGENMLAEAIRFELTCIKLRVTPPRENELE
jgi:hypothetical protein